MAGRDAVSDPFFSCGSAWTSLFLVGRVGLFYPPLSVKVSLTSPQDFN